MKKVLLAIIIGVLGLLALIRFEDTKKTIEAPFRGMGNISQEGKHLMWIAAAVTFAAFVLSVFWLGWQGLDLIVLGLIFIGFCAFFFRDPERTVQFSPDEIVCPADGRVMSIGTEKDPGTVVVRIFLSVFDVHVQRSAMAGKVGEITYTKGKFEIANKPEAADNERNLIKISDGARFAHVEQITGAIARRISCWVKTGQQVKAAQRVGLIFFGSQVALHLPASVRIIVKPGQKVEGGLTVIGLWK